MLMYLTRLPNYYLIYKTNDDANFSVNINLIQQFNRKSQNDMNPKMTVIYKFKTKKLRYCININKTLPTSNND